MRFLRAPLLAFAAALLSQGALAQAFSFDTLTQTARERAQKPWTAPDGKLPDGLAKLDYDGLRDIRYRPPKALWREGNLPFETMFFHRGKYAPEPVLVNEISPDGKVRHLPYQHTDFDYGRNAVQPQRWGDLGFAAFRVQQV